MSTKEQFGRYLEEFTIGEKIEHWPGRTITESDDTLFCSQTMNQHPLHSDIAYAEKTEFGQRVVSGPFVYSLVFGMTVDVISGKAIANLGTSEMQHVGPVHHGDTIYARSEILSVREATSRPNCGIVTVHTEGVNQNGTTILTFLRALLIPKRP